MYVWYPALAFAKDIPKRNATAKILKTFSLLG
jgi:hypothetical protein